MTAPKRVIIIGAGPCGLPALKEMLAGGHDATIFERGPSMGGIFASSEMYPDLHLTLSNWAMSFSDFPNQDLQCYPNGEEYLRYLKDYAAHFDLGKHINYNTEIISAALQNDRKWRIEVQEGPGRRVEMADALIVATGANQAPKGSPPELDGFNGRIIHSSSYNSEFQREVKEKQLRVLVIGGGESAADISADMGDSTPNTTVWLRRPNCVGPRFLRDEPEMPQVHDSKTRRYPANGFLESATTNRMSASQNVFFYGLWRRLLWSLPILNRTLSKTCLDATSSAWLMNDQATYVTKNQRMCEAWSDGKIEVLITPDVAAKGKSIEFNMPDGNLETREFDVVVLCTGYTAQFSWLKVDSFDANPRSWYLHCFPERLGHCLFFAGYARPHQGGIPPVAEMQSRYVSMVLRGDRQLPWDYAERAHRDKFTEREYYHISPDLHSLVDWNAYLESIAKRVGCEPRLPALCVLAFNGHLLSVVALVLLVVAPNVCPISVKQAVFLWTGSLLSFFVLYDGLMIKWWFYANWPIWYRNHGPDANPALVSKTLQRTNIWRDTRMTQGFVFLVWWSWWTCYVQRVISFFLFVPHVLAKRSGIRFGKTWGGFWVPKTYILHDNEWWFSDLFLP